MAYQGHVRIAVNLKPGNEPLPTEVAIATTLAEQLGVNVLLRGRNVAGGDALLTVPNRQRLRTEFKTLQSSNARSFERNLRDASRQTGRFPSAVIIDARPVGTSAADAEVFIDRAIKLVAPRRPRLYIVIVITQERIIRSDIGRS